VLLLRDSSDSAAAGEIVERANSRLASFQQMRRWMIWHERDFPRTSTQKPNLGEIRREVEHYFGNSTRGEQEARRPATALDDLITRIQRVSPGERDGGKLQLSSIERVELLSALEARYQLDLSETEFAQADTMSAIARLLDHPAENTVPSHYPRWAQSWPVRIIRAIVQNALARPAMLVLGWPRIRGRENLGGMSKPVLVVANHTTFFDPAYIREALPPQFRGKLAVAMDGELLESMRHPPKGRGFFASLADRSAYWLVVSVYNVFPLPLNAGFRKSFSFAGDLIGRGWSVLIFPEGARTKNGKMNPFRAGIGLLATQLQVPVVPMRMDGIFERGAAGKHWARPGQIKVTLGPPVRYGSDAMPEEIAKDLQRRVDEA
jgi:long-chain acyl-CoA synthetase